MTSKGGKWLQANSKFHKYGVKNIRLNKDGNLEIKENISRAQTNGFSKEFFNMEGKCSHCCKKATMICTKCSGVYYCSAKCQEQAWEYHKETCVESTKDGNLKEKCGHCHKRTSKICTGCRVVYYCSVKCQRLAWKSHKKFCNNSKQTTGERKGKNK